jgi:hypothetical protein
MPFAENISLELGAVDGKYRLYVQLRDRFNNWCNAWQSPSVVLDTILPTGNITINNDSFFTTSPWVKLGLDANDTNGVKNMSLSASADFHDAPWLPYATSFDWNLMPEEGWHNIYAKFRDPAGLESLTASASIFFDDKLPSGSFTVNSGAPYSRSGNVTLEINATDNVGLDSMEISVSPVMTGTSWVPYSRTAVFRLPEGDGQKTVHLRLKDLAGNIGEVAPVSIILDTTAPSATLLPLEPLSGNTSFKVRWAGVDRTSGIASFDVDYSVDTVNWTPWISGSMEQGALFSGSDGSIYSFRARARDLAGNTGDYFAGPESSVEVEVPPPGVEIQWPAPGARLSGVISVAGSSSTPAAERSIRRIELRIDNGTWSVANGTLSWDYLLDTSNLRPGVHLVEARAFDGTEYSTTASRLFYTTGKPAEISVGSSSLPVNLWAALTLVLAILTAVVLRLRKR